MKGPAEGVCRAVSLPLSARQKGHTQCQGTAHPLPGFLQVSAEDFPDLLLLVLGQGWKDALQRQGLGVDVPALTASIQSHTTMATQELLALRPPAGSTQGATGGCPGQGTHWMETVETAEGILPMPPLSTSSIACFISILW